MAENCPKRLKNKICPLAFYMPFFLEGVWGNLLSFGTKEKGSPSKKHKIKKIDIESVTNFFRWHH